MKFVASALLSLFVVGCEVTPNLVVPSQPSLDNGTPTSGVLDVLPNQNYLVSELWAERYTNLVANYGFRCSPPLTQPLWITKTNNGNFVVTSDAMQDFILMNILSKQHIKP
jgi:hypothetical protein